MGFTRGPLGSDRSDRRKAGRITCAHTTCQFGVVTNFSRDGCRVASKKPVQILPEGASVNLRFQAVGAEIYVPARPVSCRQRPDRWFEVGFQFLPLPDAARREIMQFARAAADNEELGRAA